MRRSDRKPLSAAHADRAESGRRTPSQRDPKTISSGNKTAQPMVSAATAGQSFRK
jgi:hypothetical protein